MIIYLDSNFVCHLKNDGTMTVAETDFFNDKCSAFIEGYRFIPTGKSWTRSDGVVFHGEMFAPAKDYRALARAQVQYELDEAAHLEELAALIEDLYNTDLEVIG